LEKLICLTIILPELINDRERILMRLLSHVLALGITVTVLAGACNNAQPIQNSQAVTSATTEDLPATLSLANDTSSPCRVELVYFHTKESCHCMTVVKDNLKYALEKNFSKEIADGRVKLITIVSDDPANAELLKAYDAMLFSLYIKEIRPENERISLISEIWNMTGDDNREKLANFIRIKVSSALEAVSS
jgi:hypothetical protein